MVARGFRLHNPILSTLVLCMKCVGMCKLNHLLLRRVLPIYMCRAFLRIGNTKDMFHSSAEGVRVTSVQAVFLFIFIN